MGVHLTGVPLKHLSEQSRDVLHTKDCMQEGAKQAAAAIAGEKAAQEMAERSRRAFHDDCRDRSAAARKQAADLDNRVVQIHTATQQRHRELKEKDARGVRTAAQNVAARKQAAQDAEVSTTSRAIQSFEGNLEKMGKATPGKRALESGGVGTEGSKAALGTTPLTQGQRLKQFLPDKDRMQREAEVRTAVIVRFVCLICLSGSSEICATIETEDMQVSCQCAQQNFQYKQP